MVEADLKDQSSLLADGTGMRISVESTELPLEMVHSGDTDHCNPKFQILFQNLPV